jgi:SagB-type dehydrogenase family enzyme
VTPPPSADFSRPPLPLRHTAAPASLEAVIRSRGSTRRFARTPISHEALSTILWSATRGFEADYRAEPARALAECFLLVNAVEGLEPGAYRYLPADARLELLRPGELREAAGHLALDQELGADAAVNVYFLAHLPSILEALGNRGYRAAQLDASVMAGKMYLAAYALGLGATGLTFYDEEVTRSFGPRAADRSPMFLIALGNAAPKT